MLGFLRKLFQTRHKSTTFRRRSSARPTLEMLEDRWAPAVLTVNSLADSTTAGTALTLREAIMVVDGTLGRSLNTAEQAQFTGTLGSKDTIQFNLPAGPQTITLSGGTLSITNPVAINGPGASLLTITGNNAVRDFYLGSGFTKNLNLVVSMSGLTIAGGNQQYGSGLFTSATLTLTNTTISNNIATNNGGGGIYNTGALTLNNCTFTNNSTVPGTNGATAGGGLLNFSTGTVSITNCNFTGNTAPGTGSTAGSGGALSTSGTMTITGSTFTSNTAGSDGGAIYNDGALTMTNTTLTGNSVNADGGAIRSGLYDGYSTLTMTGCTLTGNFASSEGGGLDGTWSALSTITNCTFTSNVAGTIGGGLGADGPALYLTNDTFTANRVTTVNASDGGGGIYIQAPVTLNNTIVAGNFGGPTGTAANDIMGTISTASSYNLIGTGGAGGLVNGTNGNKVGVANAGLGALANNSGPTQTVALLPGSPAIAAGSTTFVTAGETDQRGLPRTVNGTVDIGAYELQPTTVTSTAPSNQTGVQGVTGTFNLGSFKDTVATAGPWSVNVIWGDGTSASTFTINTQGALGTLTHAFQPSGTFIVTVIVTDAIGNASQATFQVTVPVSPEVLTVNSLADSTAANTALTLREAVALVNGTLGRALTAGEQAQITGTLGVNPTIQFNLPAGPQTITLTGGPLNLTAPVTINGPGAANLTISGNNADRVFIIGTISSLKLSLVDSINGLTISGGKQTYGAGVINFSTLSINNCVISNNVAGTSGGGGIYNGGALTLANTTLNANSTGAKTDGGGLYNISTGTATVTNCTFTNNVAGGTGSSGSQGGGAFNSGTITLTGCTFNANSAGSDAGAFFTNATATITYCTFTNNVSGADGGALHSTGALIISNCLVAGNSASSSGGGMEQSSIAGTVPNSLLMTNTTFVNNIAYGTAGGLVTYISNATLINDTFTGNHSENSGGGIWAAAALTLQNCIVAGNLEYSTPNDISGNVSSSSSYNLIGTGGAGGMSNGSKGNQVGVANPGLGALASNGGPTQTVALLTGSPAIDKGNNSYVTSGATDQRGFTRIVNGTVDIGAFEVQGPSATTFTVSGFPSSVTAGTAATITVTAKTATGAIATGYVGTVHFTSSDLQAVLPANFTFAPSNNGVFTFSVTLKTAGTQTITATDTATASITATQSGITVTSAAASVFSVAGFPNPTIAGVAGSFTVTARDVFGNAVPTYTGTVHFTSSDPQAALPANYTFVAANNGVATFSATLKTAGAQSVTATDTTTGITGVHAAITVAPASASTFALVGFPSPTTAGAAGTFTLTAMDSFGNIATGYVGTIHFTSSDPKAVLPADYTFVAANAGAKTFSATFKTTGTQTITAADKTTSTITGTHAGITVNPAALGSFTVVGFPSPIAAGVAGTFTVTAVDIFGNLDTTYAGTVHFTSSDAQGVLPANYTFVVGDHGVHTFSATLKTAGSQTIAATDAAAGVSGVHSAITVTPASAVSLAVAGFPSLTQAGVSAVFTVTAVDAFGNAATGYLGTIHFTSSDARAVLPANYTFVAADNGVHTFHVTFGTAGAQTITAVDTTTATITGASAAVTVSPAATGPVLLVNSTADTLTPDNFLDLREAIALVDGTLGRALTAAEQAQITGTLGANATIAFNLPAGPQTITLTGGALDITQPVTIVGPGAGNLTINGNNVDRVLIVGQIWSENLSLVVSISGLTIAGGNQSYAGGLLNFGTLTLNNTAFANNTAGSSGGGGMYNVGTATLNSCTFTGNTVSGSADGGAIENITSGTLTINNCTFTGNTGTNGAQGAAIGSSGTVTITGSTFTGNSAASDGGAIYNDGALTISTTTFANNVSASDGGAIRSAGTLTISASTFSGNSAASCGGALDTSDSTVSVINSTFANNVAVSEGGGVFNDANSAVFTNCTITANRVNSTSSGVGGGLMAFGSITINNTIIAGNFGGATGTAANDVGGTLNTASAYNLIGAGGAGGLVNGINNNQVGVVNLGLGVLANNGGPTLTIALLPGSPALATGSTIFVVAGETDQRGLPRTINGSVDIGAFEI